MRDRHDGFEIRTATPEDAAAVRQFLEELSADSRWLRYHTGVPMIRTWMVDSVVGADHEHHESLIAWNAGRIVGIAEWGRVALSDRTADIGIVVRDDCRRHGIARALLRRLERNARRHGIDAFTGSVLSTNRGTLALVADVAPFSVKGSTGPTIEVTVPLHATA